jgi:hypothetical protein
VKLSIQPITPKLRIHLCRSSLLSNRKILHLILFLTLSVLADTWVSIFCNCRYSKIIRYLVILEIMSSHKSSNNNNSKEGVHSVSIIVVLASQYRSHSVPLANAPYCQRWFLSVGSRWLYNMQKGLGRVSKRLSCVPSSHARRIIGIFELIFYLASPVFLAISCLHGFWDNFISSLCPYAL